MTARVASGRASALALAAAHVAEVADTLGLPVVAITADDHGSCVKVSLHCRPWPDTEDAARLVEALGCGDYKVTEFGNDFATVIGTVLLVDGKADLTVFCAPLARTTEGEDV